MVVPHFLIRIKSAMTARLMFLSVLSLTLFGCAQTPWQHVDGSASLDRDSRECAELAKVSYPTRLIGFRVVDNAATRQAREKFKLAGGFKSQARVKPPVVYVTRKYDRNRHARTRSANQCLRTKGWVNHRRVAS